MPRSHGLLDKASDISHRSFCSVLNSYPNQLFERPHVQLELPQLKFELQRSPNLANAHRVFALKLARRLGKTNFLHGLQGNHSKARVTSTALIYPHLPDLAAHPYRSLGEALEALHLW
jgi:hypothetical protein